MALHKNLNRFNAGEWSPLLDGRWDLEDYSAACRSLDGFIPLKYGPAERTTGTEYVASTKNGSTEKSRLVRFRFSADTSYILEMGNLYIRFYKGGATGTQIESGGSPYEIVSPYAEADLFTLQFVQINDIMYIVHKDYPVYKLSRIAETNWTLAEVDWTFPPLLDINGTTTTLYASGTTGSVTLNASSGIFASTDVGAYYAITHQRDAQEQNVDLSAITTGQTSAIPVKGSWTLITSGIWQGTIKIQRRIGGGAWETIKEASSSISGDTSTDNYTITANESSDDAEYRLDYAITANGTAPTFARFQVDAIDVTGFAKITAYTSPTQVTATVKKAFEKSGSANAVVTWTEGAFSETRGYPGACTFFENRLIFGGTDYRKLQLWLSQTDDFENFGTSTPDILDTDSLSYQLNSVEQNRIKWIRAQKYLLIGTEGEEYSLRGADGNALSPSTLPLATVESTEGSSGIRPVIVGDTLLFWSRDSRRLNELSFSVTKDGFGTDDITELAEHITTGGIVQSAYTQDPYRILWNVRKDGVIVGLVYNRTEEVIAWFTRSTDGEFESIESIYGDPDDEVWVIAKRTVGGSTVRYVERFSFRQTALENMLYADSGVKYSGASTTTVTGLSHLEGKTVSVLADGNVEDDKVVSSGQITLDNASTKVSVGLAFDSEIETMKIEAPAGDGASRDKQKRLTHVLIGMYNTLGGQYGIKYTEQSGTEKEELSDINFRDTSDPMDSAPPLFSGEKFRECAAGHHRDVRMVYKQTQPLPATITFLIPRITPKGP